MFHTKRNIMILRINTEINDKVADDIIRQLDKRSGDTTILYIDSNGGEVDAALRIFTKLQEVGNVTTIADGSVFSAAIIVFLGGYSRKMNRESSFMVHPAAFDSISNVTQADLEELQKEIEQYTVIIEDLYRYCGVKECLVKYLRGSYDFVINECDAAYKNGLLTECCYNGDSSIIKQIKHGMPFLNKRVVQSFKYKSQSIKKILNFYDMNKNMTDILEAIKRLNSKIDNVSRGTEKSVRKLLNEILTKGECTNEAIALTPDQASSLADYFLTFDASIDGTNVAHVVFLSKEKKGGVLVLDSEYKKIELEEGDYAAIVDGEQVTIKVKNGGSIVNEEEEVTNEDPEEVTNEDPEKLTNEEPEKLTNEDTEDAPAFSTSTVTNKKSAAPSISNKKLPRNNDYKKNILNALKRGIGAGAVGTKSK